jgi:hypothetical protein
VQQHPDDTKRKGSALRTATPTTVRARRPSNWGGRVGRLGPRHSPDGSGQRSP